MWAWWAHILPVVKNWLFYTSGLTATASDRRLSTASNMGFVKQKVWCAHKPGKLPITYSLGKKQSKELLEVIVTTQDCCLEFSSIAGTVWRSFVFQGPSGRPCPHWRKAILKWRPFLWAPDTLTLTQVCSTVLEDVSWSDMWVMIGNVFWN